MPRAYRSMTVFLATLSLLAVSSAWGDAAQRDRCEREYAPRSGQAGKDVIWVPTQEELNLDGLDIDQADLDKLLEIDIERWRQEAGFRQKHLEQFDGLPEAIWEAHRRVTADLDAEA